MIASEQETTKTPPRAITIQRKREEVFTTDLGSITFTWWSPMSQEEYDEVAAWLEIVKRQMRRVVLPADQLSR